MAGSDQLLSERSTVDAVDLASICPCKELGTLTSACQRSDSTFNLEFPVQRKQRFGLTLRHLFPAFPFSLTLWSLDFPACLKAPHWAVTSISNTRVRTDSSLPGSFFIWSCLSHLLLCTGTALETWLPGPNAAICALVQ